MVHFSKEKKRVAFLVGFVGLYYRKWDFLKTPGWFF